MSADRVRRAERMVELRKRAVDLAQSADAEGARRVHEAEETARACEVKWSTEAAAQTTRGCMSSAELATASAWLRGLRTQADRAADEVVAARAEAQRRREALIAARGELRKIELWRDGLVAAARAVLERKERVAADEVAARTVRRPS